MTLSVAGCKIVLLESPIGNERETMKYVIRRAVVGVLATPLIAMAWVLFVAVLVGVSLIGPIADQVNTAAVTGGSLANASSWGATVLKLVPGFFSLIILGTVVAGLYTVFRQAGIV